jgi:cold shock CspA family protein
MTIVSSTPIRHSTRRFLGRLLSSTILRAAGELRPYGRARVKWFNAEKGFGFVELTDGSGEAFLHIRQLEAAGYTMLDSGTRWW